MQIPRNDLGQLFDFEPDGPDASGHGFYAIDTDGHIDNNAGEHSTFSIDGETLTLTVEQSSTCDSGPGPTDQLDVSFVTADVLASLDGIQPAVTATVTMDDAVLSTFTSSASLT